MKKNIIFVIFILILLSCNLMTSNDKDNINMLISKNSGLLIENYDYGEEEGDTKTVITPLLWYREKADTIINILTDIEILDDSAFVDIKVILNGIMNVAYINDSLDTVKIQKSFIDTLNRNAIFLKDTTKTYYGGWRLLKITNGWVNSNSITIDSIKLYAENIIDTVIDNIEYLYKKDKIIILPASTDINIYVYTPDTLDIFYVHSYFKRAKFTFENGVFTGTWRTPSTFGIYRCVIDGMTEGTLFDDEIDYDCAAWFIPYRCE